MYAWVSVLLALFSSDFLTKILYAFPFSPFKELAPSLRIVTFEEEGALLIEMVKALCYNPEGRWLETR
jgi:hypothetical protein